MAEPDDLDVQRQRGPDPMPFTSNIQRTTALSPWLIHYNTTRAHSALAGQPPTSRLSPT
ncbi:hypothetical protein [Kineococcus sp. TRM81007]|uniref:hypothetical protein n=1 Tax=Kineococcus sp. TRM81007 TaxID=2925831 RepID=UPI0035A83667